MVTKKCTLESIFLCEDRSFRYNISIESIDTLGSIRPSLTSRAHGHCHGDRAEEGDLNSLFVFVQYLHVIFARNCLFIVQLFNVYVCLFKE